MATKHKSDAQTLEDYRVALANAVNQPEVAATMAEFGYSAEEIEQGTQLLASTSDAYNLNKQEDNETISARAAFDAKKEELEEMYSLHRKKAKVALRKEPVGYLGSFCASAFGRLVPLLNRNNHLFYSNN